MKLKPRTFTCKSRSPRACPLCQRILEIRVRNVRVPPSDIRSARLQAWLPSTWREHLLIRACIHTPAQQLVVLCQRIPINNYGLDAPLRNDARHGLAADLESPKLPEMSAQKYLSWWWLLCVTITLQYEEEHTRVGATSKTTEGFLYFFSFTWDLCLRRHLVNICLTSSKSKRSQWNNDAQHVHRVIIPSVFWSFEEIKWQYPVSARLTLRGSTYSYYTFQFTERKIGCSKNSDKETRS